MVSLEFLFIWSNPSTTWCVQETPFQKFFYGKLSDISGDDSFFRNIYVHCVRCNRDAIFVCSIEWREPSHRDVTLVYFGCPPTPRWSTSWSREVRIVYGSRVSCVYIHINGVGRKMVLHERAVSKFTEQKMRHRRGQGAELSAAGCKFHSRYGAKTCGVSFTCMQRVRRLATFF